jgi:hypothetical protein
MSWGFGSRSIGIGSICLMAAVVAGALVEPAAAQAQQVDGFGMWGTANGFYPLWARPYVFSGFDGPSLATGSNQYTTKLGSGTVGMFVQSYGQGSGGWGSGGWARGSSDNYFSPLSGSPTSLRENWFAAGDPAWGTSIVGSYRSEPNAALSGLYTTASFGLTNIRTSPLGLPGVTNFSSGNEAVGMTASAGVGLKLTPNITVEGSVSFTQMQPSSFK